MQLSLASGGRRGCGRRKKGGVYWEVGLAPWGRPVEAHLVDPPLPIPVELEVSTQGVTPLVKNGVMHLVDWVGATHYPLVTDFVEEVRRKGLSRRIPLNAPWLELSTDSKLVLVHPRALIPGVAAKQFSSTPECPTHRGAGVSHYHHVEYHEPTDRWDLHCVGWWYFDVTEEQAPDLSQETYWSLRHFPDEDGFSYEVLPFDISSGLQHEPGFFMTFGCQRIVVVKGDEGEHERPLQVLSDRCPFPVALVDE